MPRDYRDYENELEPVRAHMKGLTTPLARDWWADFVTTAIAAKIEAALDKAGIPFFITDNPTIEIEPTERRRCPVYTLADIPRDFSAKQILAVMWAYSIDQPGTLYLENDVLKFRADPVAPLAPPPIVSAGDQMGVAAIGSPPVVGVEGKMLQELLFNFRRNPGWVEFK